VRILQVLGDILRKISASRNINWQVEPLQPVQAGYVKVKPVINTSSKANETKPERFA